MTRIGYIVWDIKKNCRASRPYARQHDALANAWSGVRYMERAAGMLTKKPPKGYSIVPCYADNDGRWESLQD